MLLRSRLDSQYDGSEFLPPSYAQDASADFRRDLDTEVTALDWRGTLAPGVVGSARASRSVDDSLDGGSVKERFRTEREQIAAQLAWQTGVLGQFVAAIEHDDDQAQATPYTADVRRRNTAGVLELTGSAAAWSWQGDLRLDDNSDFGARHHRPPGRRLALGAGVEAACPGRHHLPRTQLQRPVLPRLRRAHAPARARAQHRGRRVVAGRRPARPRPPSTATG